MCTASIFFAACGDDAAPLTDAGPVVRTDAGPRRDAGGPRDAGPRADAGAMSDAGGTDAARPDAGGPSTCPDEDLGMMLGTPVTTGSTSTATETFVAECAAGEASRAVRYGWTAPAAGTYSIDTFGSSFDTALVVLGPECGLPEVACSDDEGKDVQSRVVITAAEGETFTIIVTGYDADETGAYELSISQPPPTEAACTDGMDNDRDGLTDCNDDDCAEEPACIETDCTNMLDDDMDGATDCEDFDCSEDPACVEDCVNGSDDDIDGYTDCEDPDCDEDPACAGMEHCINGMDDDGDGAVDCDDADCAMHPDCGPPMLTCATILCAPGFTCFDCPGGAMCLPAGVMCPTDPPPPPPPPK